VEFIPNDLVKILKKLNRKSIYEIVSKLSVENQKIVKEYIDFLIAKEFAVMLDREECVFFPKMSVDWDIPCLVSNAVITYSDVTKNGFLEILEQLDKLFCSSFVIVFPDVLRYSDLISIIKMIETFSFQEVKIMLNYHSSFNIENIPNLLLYHNVISTISIFNSNLFPEKDFENIDFFENTLPDYNSCGNISSSMFILNLSFFTESQQHNTCLNRKLCIDAEGNIKNCPSMTRSFGNIKDTTLQEAIEKEGFKDLWFIHKDKIDVCKDCEFRYMCTDCRCFIKDPQNIYSQPAKCGYNPYICKWAGQEGYVSVEECGSYSRETGFVPNATKIKELNRQIWGEDNE
jgi:SPASM domain peptide maturase of grasp-with-spasm system